MISKLGPVLLAACGVIAIGGCQRQPQENHATGIPQDMGAGDVSQPGQPRLNAPSTDLSSSGSASSTSSAAATPSPTQGD